MSELSVHCPLLIIRFRREFYAHSQLKRYLAPKRCSFSWSLMVAMDIDPKTLWKLKLEGHENKMMIIRIGHSFVCAHGLLHLLKQKNIFCRFGWGFWDLIVIPVSRKLPNIIMLQHIKIYPSINSNVVLEKVGGGGGLMRCCYCNIAVTSSAMRHKGFGNDVIIDNIHTFITFYIQNYANQ